VTFSPNGSQIVLDQDPGTGRDEISLMPAAGGTPVPIKQDDQERVDPDWQPIPVNCGGKRSTLVGTESADKLVGTSGRDVISGLGGKDFLKGLKGNDILCGGKGKDRLSAGKGKKDRCIGGKGRDRTGGCEIKKSI
jgi:Ca2+-binding RTX toxin-like protein